MNWKTYTEKLNAKTYVLPDGWDSKEKIAEQLECSTEKVDDHLRPALKSGAVIKQQFKVWNTELKRNVMVWAYQETSKAEVPAESVETPDADSITAMKDKGLTWAQIGAKYGKTGEAIRKIYAKLL